MAAGLLEGFLSAGIAGFALLLLVVALAAWRRVGGAKLAAMAGAFAVFALKGLWFTWEAFAPGQAGPPALGLLLPDFAVLALLYVATVR
jgi:hypothetical protein